MARPAANDGALPRALCITGPTASGKTAVAMAIAEALPVEIVSVDSALVYHGMDIGTAKPSASERAQVAHHLVDILDPAQTYSAARFAADARRLIDDIRSRRRVPLLVGGTMLYFKALLEGIDPMPEADAALRAEIDAQAEREGWPALHAALAKVDPATAARLPPTDAQRIQRALEVYRASGIPLSHWHANARNPGDVAAGPQGPGANRFPGEADGAPASAGRAPAQGEGAWPAGRACPRIDLPLISLEPDDRAWLHRRIALRFETMMAAGFLDEIRALRSRGDLHTGLPSMRCVGYRQAWEALDEGTPQALAGLPERAIAATRQLAKRQLTWLRSMPSRQVVPADAPDATSRAVERALAVLRGTNACTG